MLVAFGKKIEGAKLDGLSFKFVSRCDHFVQIGSSNWFYLFVIFIKDLDVSMWI